MVERFCTSSLKPSAHFEVCAEGVNIGDHLLVSSDVVFLLSIWMIAGQEHYPNSKCKGTERRATTPPPLSVPLSLSSFGY